MMATTTTTTTNTPITTRPRKSRTETAWNWFLRHQRRVAAKKALEDLPPETPVAAAWAFFRASVHGGTGVSFVDESLKRCRHFGTFPVMEIRDPKRYNNPPCGKTRTLVSLAARFVVSTRPSLFTSSTTTTPQQQLQQQYLEEEEEEGPPLPFVLFLDSNFDVTPLLLANAVLSQLLRHPKVDMDHLEQDMEECLSRIHVFNVNDIREWMAQLECIRAHLLKMAKSQEQQVDVPTLILWDGFLSEPTTNIKGLQKEVARPMARILRDCSVGFFYTRSGYSSLDRHHFYAPPLKNPGANATPQQQQGSRPLLQTVILERDETTIGRRHEYRATVVQGKQQIPYSLSAAGVLP